MGKHEEVQHQCQHFQVIKHLHDKVTRAVFFNGSIGDWFRTIDEVRQGCLLSPTLFNIFLERILTDALEDHEGTVNIGSRAITYLRFADDTDGLAGQKELAKLVERLDKASTVYGMEINAFEDLDDKHYQWHQQGDQSKRTET